MPYCINFSLAFPEIREIGGDGLWEGFWKLEGGKVVAKERLSNETSVGSNEARKKAQLL